MFINCRHCNTLVATDPATGLPPERCPRCAGVLRRPAPAVEAPTADAQVATDAGIDPSPDAGKREPTPALGPAATAHSGIAPAPAPAAADAPGPTAPAIAQPDAPSAPVSEAAAAEAAPVATPSAAPAVAAPVATPSAAPAEAGATLAAATSAHAADAAAGTPAPPEFLGAIPTPAAQRGPRAWRQPVVIVALLALLGLQIVLADRERLAADARWRP